MITVTLPWPDRKLSPNARVHWAQKAKVARAAKAEAYAITRQALGSHRFHGAVRLDLTFCPPSHRRHDIDNLMAKEKPRIDGISSAIGIDDSRFEILMRKGGVRKGGAVLVRIFPLESGQ